MSTTIEVPDEFLASLRETAEREIVVLAEEIRRDEDFPAAVAGMEQAITVYHGLCGGNPLNVQHVAHITALHVELAADVSLPDDLGAFDEFARRVAAQRAFIELRDRAREAAGVAGA